MRLHVSCSSADILCEGEQPHSQSAPQAACHQARALSLRIQAAQHPQHPDDFILCVAVLFLDFVAVLFQFICFPVYGIPKVPRKDYVVMDRWKLSYLNSIEKWNCVYCEYVNGVLAFVQEIAGRTEQYWCPIKHALRAKNTHSRYSHFLDYGDADQYRQRLEQVRRDFNDLKKGDSSLTAP